MNIFSFHFSYGRNAIKNCVVNPSEKISKPELIGDLHERGVKFTVNEKKKPLKEKYQNELCGIHHIPAIVFNACQPDLSKVGLKSYEILPVEPLHTIAGHIKNLYKELPSHLKKEDKEVFEDVIEASFSGKEAKKGADYRKSLVNVTLYLMEKDLDKKYSDILVQLCEIQEIVYAEALQRTAKSILRLHNLTFLHALSLIDAIVTTKKLTERKLFGQYFHALIDHAPQQFRIIDLTASNAEDEERAFNFLKEVSKRTSNRHPENVLMNAFIRLQVRDDWNDNIGALKKTRRNEISRNGDKLKEKRCNTVFGFELIERYPEAWQAHLERIPDYLHMNVW